MRSITNGQLGVCYRRRVRASFELGFEIGRLNDASGKEESPYSLSMIIEFMGGQEETGYALLQASTTTRLKKLVPELANLSESQIKSSS